MNYLDNNLCNFTPLFNIDYSVKKDIISCCMFKMCNKGYKDFSIYIDGLKTMYDYVQKTEKKHGFQLRLFIDSTVYEDKQSMSKLEKMKHLQIVLYDCPLVKDPENPRFHKGLFGTLIRFFPMFDFPNNDARKVIIADTDTITEYKKRTNMLKLLSNEQKEGTYMLLMGNIGKNAYFDYPSCYKGHAIAYTFAHSIVSFQRINKNLLLDFIRSVAKSNDLSHTYYTRQLQFGKQNKFHGNVPFIYGVDEYFINKILIEYLIDNQMPHISNIIWNISSSIFYLFIYDTFTKSEQVKLHLLLDYIIDKFKLFRKPTWPLIKKFKIIDREIFNDSSKVSLKINAFLYSFFLNQHKNNDVSFIFPPSYYKALLSTDLYMSYDFNIVKFPFTHRDDMIICKKKFPDSYKKKFDKLRPK